MGDLSIRRNRGFVPVRYEGTAKSEKAAGSSQTQKPARTPGFTVSETLRQLMGRANQVESRSRESRRTLQLGESVLDEVQDRLDSMLRLARASAAGGETDRAALQKELESLKADIDRMAGSAVSGEARLFLDSGTGGADGIEALLQALLEKAAGSWEAAQPLPGWLVSGMTQDTPTAEQLLSDLGLDQSASGADILAAVMSQPLESGSAAGYLACLYLGAVISGGAPSGEIDMEQALEGLEQLLEKVADGVPLDQAIEELTNGEFTGIEDFQSQFSAGTAPGMEEFLTGLLLAEGGAPLLELPSLLTLLAGYEGMNLELMMTLLSAVPGPEAGLEAGPAAGQTEAGQPSPVSVMELGELQVLGRDLSAVSFHPAAGELVVEGAADVIIQGAGQQGTGQTAESILITGSGTVTLQRVNVPVLTAGGEMVRVFTVGENTLGEIRLGEGTSLTLDGGGLLRVGGFLGGGGNTLRLTGGAVVLAEKGDGTPGTLALPVLIEGAASLAARASSVSDAYGKPAEPFDIVWKTLLPGWSSVTGVTVDGGRAKMSLLGGEIPDPARLWLAKGDNSHGYTVHTLAVRGRDESGRPQTRYAYLRWSQNAAAFQLISMYPNPFAVTGGEPGRDWVYEEETHTLRILSAQVTAISGGSGTDANQIPFSGRVALADGIGGVELTLGGVICRVPSGSAFDLGSRNHVSLLLQSGRNNVFLSGAGFAGISLGDGTSLSIDRAGTSGGREPDGTLTASGTGGGAGIGRDSGAGRDRDSRILICGGVITATGSGGGAGIGAGRQGAMGSITILGGVIHSTGEQGGGAGIGGALGAPVGDISIRGGTVTAAALYHAAAIGAGIQGECGDILISGTARIEKAVGGTPGADIGACLFGGCGTVLVSGGADIGSAGLLTRAGVPLRMGEESVTLPQFPLSSEALGLEGLDLSTQARAQKAETGIEAGRLQVSQIQAVYAALYSQLERSFGSLRGVRQYAGAAELVVRDGGSAGTLLEHMRQSILLEPSQALQTHGRRGAEDVRQLLR